MVERITQHVVDGTTHELDIAADRDARVDLQRDRGTASLGVRGEVIR